MKSKVLKELILNRPLHKFSVLLLSFFATTFGLLAPFFQKGFIDVLSPASPTASNPANLSSMGLELNLFQYILGAVFFLFLSQVFFQLANLKGVHEALVAQRKLAKDLYNQVLSLKKNSWKSLSVGEIISFYTTDIPGSTLLLEQTLPQGASVFFPLILSPVALSLFFDIPIWHTALMILFISLINIYLGLKQSRFFYLFKALSSDRVAIVNEWIQNIYFLKVLNLITLFENKIFEIRERETLNRFNMTRNGQVMNSISSSITFLINVIGLIALIFISNKEFSTGDLLAMTWILGVFLVKPFRQLPWLFTFAFDAWSSIQRLNQFYEQTADSHTTTDLNNSNTNNQNLNDKNITVKNNIALSLKNLNFKISFLEILKDLSFDIQEGELIAIVGEVGSGKTSLLYSLIGETNPQYEAYHILNKSFTTLTPDELSESFTLVPQEGFILSATLKENITLDYNSDTYSDEEVLKSLSLAEFHLNSERFPDGLQTRIGERGIDLSGGQKQRLSLARAHFLKAKIVLLDDCLSALDSHTERKITQNLICDAWKSKTRLLVTHRLDILPLVDRVLFMHQGKIIDFDSYEQL
nr:ABC transporter ATP-binding protein/permease [Pseudobdellovibrionaceae bacterium]